MKCRTSIASRFLECEPSCVQPASHANAIDSLSSTTSLNHHVWPFSDTWWKVTIAW